VVSPTRIVALIVGTVVALGAIISFWGTQLVQTRLNESRTSEDVCLGAMLRLYSGGYDSDKEELLLILENPRGVDLELKALYLFYPNKEMKTFELNKALQSNMLLSIPVKDVEDGFESGTVKTNCPDVTVDFSYSDVT
jgi:hypothetical protein